MRTMSEFVTGIKLYSIDGALLDVLNMPLTDLLKLGMTIKTSVYKNICIPVCFGIAPKNQLLKS